MIRILRLKARLAIQTCVLTLLASSASALLAQQVTEVVTPVLIQLSEIKKNLDIVKLYLHKQDFSRIETLQEAVTEAHQAVFENSISNKTKNKLFLLYVRFNSSTFFFESIQTDRSKFAIKAIMMAYENIYKLSEFDEAPISQVYYALLSQIDECLRGLLKIKDLSEPYRTALSNEKLTMDLRSAMAKSAARGDTAVVTNKAGDVACDIYKIYDVLYELRRNKTADRYVIEIMLVNERIAKQADVDPIQCSAPLHIKKFDTDAVGSNE